MSRYLSYDDMEVIAARVLRAYEKLPEVSATDLLYVDPDLLLRSLLGLKIEYRHLSAGGLILGLTAYEEIGIELIGEDGMLEWFFFDGKTVLIDKNLHGGRKNFTIVHEGCHHILKMLFPKDYGSGTDARQVIQYRDGFNLRDREEWQVNYLTSLILMPRKLVEQALHLAGIDGRINMLNSVWRRKEYEAFCNMCLLLGVSKQALSLRMKRLGLLGEDYLARPNEILDIWKGDDDIG